MIVIVTGGRAFNAASVVFGVLDVLHQQTPLAMVAHGACGLRESPAGFRGNMTGADGLADEWACSKAIQVFRFPVEARHDGPWPAAGPKRNGRMLRSILQMNVNRASTPPLKPFPLLVVAFDGGRGTADCVRQARGLGLNVMRVVGTGPYHTEAVA